MLVTNPTNRATLHEVLSHPWMVRGHTGQPDAHMVHRDPLRSDELDRQVIRGMQGFEFGSEEEIERKLVKILDSEAYIRAVQFWERKRGVSDSLLNGSSSSTNKRWGYPTGGSFSNSSLAISFDSSSTNLHGGVGGQQAPLTPSKKSRRFSGFDYYRRKLFSPSTSPPSSPQSHSPPGSQNHLLGNFGPGLAEGQKEPADPTRGFHPLISMYYLAREKLERDRVYGPGHFASSQLSVLETGKDATTKGDGKKEKEQQQQQLASTGTTADDTLTKHPHFTTTPPTPVRKDATPSATVKPDYSMPLPRLPAPDPSHYGPGSYDVGGGAPSPTTPTGPQPRARDLGLPPTPTTPGMPVSPVPQPNRRPVEPVEQSQQRLPRAPPAGAHRRSHSLSQRPTVLSRGWGSMFGHGGHGRGTVVDEHGLSGGNTGIRGAEGPRTAGPEITTFPVPTAVDESAEDREREEQEKAQLQLQQAQQQQQQQDAAAAAGGGLVSGGSTLVRKFGSLLVGRGGSATGGSGSVSEDGRKSTSSGYTYSYGIRRGTSPRPSGDALKDTEKVDTAGVTPITQSQSQQTNGTGTTSSAKATPLTTSVSQPVGSVHRRAATILDPQGRRGHERRSSTGGALMGASSSPGANASPGGTTGRNRRPSTGYSSRSGQGRPIVERLFTGSGQHTHQEGPEDEHAEDDQADHDDLDEHDERDGADKDGDGQDDKAGTDNEKDYKPVYLKGLFSVATTSSKSPYVIKADIRRVLDRMQVQYREIRAGFECIHSPSIDMASVEPATSRSSHGQYLSGSGGHYQQTSGGEQPQGYGYSPPGQGPTRGPSIVKKASKLSFGMKKKEKEKEKEKKDEEKAQGQQPQTTGTDSLQPQGRPSGATGLTATPSSGSSSFFNVSNHTVVGADPQQQLAPPPHSQQSSQHNKEGSDNSPPTSYSPSNKSKVLPPIPRDFATTSTGGPGSIAPPRSPSPLPSGEVGKEVFDTIAKNSLSVRFEINIVKVQQLFHRLFTLKNVTD